MAKEIDDDEVIGEAPPRGRPADRLDRLERDEEVPKSPKSKPVKKKRGCAVYVLALLLIMGMLAGLQASGVLDMRNAIYYGVPRLPWIGKDMANIMGIPKIYALTAQERRALELNESKIQLDTKTRGLEAEIKRLEALSGDLTLKEEDIAKLQKELTERLQAIPKSDDIKDMKEQLADLLQTYQDMSPKNAAAIFEKLDQDLAVTMLSLLPQEQTSKILSRMDATLAAQLTERLSKLGN